MESSHASTDDPLEELVAQCLEGGREENADTLARLCQAHPEHADELRRRVRALDRLGMAGVASRADDDFPERLGEFVLLDRLGGGGMGVVFRARQESLGREVALKVIRPEHLYFPRARERFRRETEAVARLQHPGIVPIYTVGAEGGVPYFAMELVRGCTLAEILSELQGRAPERLDSADVAAAMTRLMAQRGETSLPTFSHHGPWISLCMRWAIEVAQALAHAHDRGVLHRDVKPSNIAITLDGQARLIDFGLASMGDEEQRRLTASGATLGSLMYMSPEQLRGESHHATTRSDVYALGVTLHEMLSLQAPYHDTSPVDLRQAILDGRADALRSRNRAVSRDLEIVCMKAMDPSPSRRYASAEDFARDLQNVVELRSIEARPPSAMYKSVRWVQRNPAPSVSIALGVAVVVGVPLTLMWQARVHAREVLDALDAAVEARREADEQREAAQAAELIAQQERDRALDAERESVEQRDAARREALKASQVSDLITQLFLAASPINARGREPLARDILDAGIERVERELDDQPEVQAELLDAIGGCYTALSVYDRAEHALFRALDLRRQVAGENSLEVADSYFSIAHLQRVVGDKRALESAKLAERMQRELAPDDLEGRIDCLMCVALSATSDTQRPFALEKMEEAYELLGRLPDAPQRLRRNVLSNYANTLYRSSRYEEAVRVANESLALEHSLGGEPHPGLASSLNAKALALKHLDRLEEALETYDELLEVGEALHGVDNDRYGTFLLNKASLLDEMRRTDEAYELLLEAREVFDGSAPDAHPQRITVYGNLGGLCARTGRWAQGCDAFEVILPQMIESLGPRHYRVALSQHYYGLCLEGVSDLDGAAEQLGAALDTTLANYGDEDLRVARLRVNLASVLARSGGNDARVRELVEPALPITRPDPRYASAAATGSLALARVERRAGNRELAAHLLVEAVRHGETVRPDHWTAFAARIELGPGATDDAAAWRAEREQDFTELVVALGPTHPETLHCRRLLDDPARR